MAMDVIDYKLYGEDMQFVEIELDPGEVQCGLFDVGAGKRLNAKEIGVVREHEALFVHADGGRGNFQDRKSTRLNSSH